MRSSPNMYNIDIIILFQHITVNDFVNTAPIGHRCRGAYIYAYVLYTMSVVF